VSKTGSFVHPHVGAPPVGFAIAQGQTLLRVLNPELFGQIGATWGAPSADTFSLPLLSDRFLRASGSGGVGAFGGEDSVALSVTQIPAHSHGLNVTVTNPPHSHPAGADVFYKSQPTGTFLTTNTSGGAQVGASGVPANTAAAGVTVGVTMDPVGSGGGHENKPPFVTVHMLLRLG
jgi:microcystin-dependent protein